MSLTRICEVYFSPCGSVKKVVSGFARYAAGILSLPVETIDFTLPGGRKEKKEFKENDLVFFGTPVYAGRVPNKIMPYIREGFAGNGAFAVPVVVFGNRSFDDALVELRNLLKEDGFYAVAGAAVAARHSFSDKIAPERPDEKDCADMREFTERILLKLEKMGEHKKAETIIVPGTNPPDKYYVPLGTDGQPAKFLKAYPKTKKEQCNSCGICAKNCPMGSIDQNDSAVVTGICIKCQACIRKCPKQAKYFDDKAFLSHKQMLEETYVQRAESKFFV